MPVKAPQTPISQCKAKNPANCPYHGVYVKLEAAEVNLRKLGKMGDNLLDPDGVMDEYFEARKAVEELTKLARRQNGHVPDYEPNDVIRAFTELNSYNPEDVDYDLVDTDEEVKDWVLALSDGNAVLNFNEQPVVATLVDIDHNSGNGAEAWVKFKIGNRTFDMYGSYWDGVPEWDYENLSLNDSGDPYNDYQAMEFKSFSEEK